ncbi:sensor domain-containing diguanylate cyclase [Candidatus Cryosericum terrychapinii]|uniref:Sensor domain-containing diguanylate cyclase n=2 Tax=Candidatus Cryosericum terrychapinii TaxID=2290919 RepID=A0A398CR57_9BACT|nr:sensor domain-containing diguanylate cyclase [Candidatus Cryosericum terrychapinii]
MPGVRRRCPRASPTAWSTSSRGAGKSHQTTLPSSSRSRDCGAGRTICANQEDMMNMGVLDESLREILDAVSDGVYVTTREREIVFWSKGAERITGYSSDEVLSRHCHDNILVHTDVLGKNLCFDGCPLQKCIETGERQEVKEVFLKRKDGERLTVYIKASVLQVGNERYGVEVFGELQSVAGSALAEQLRKLSDASIVDQLTGLYNRRYIDTILDQQYGLFKRHFQRFGIVMIDVDKFKNINDSFGFLAGDEALKFVASVVQRSMRSMDFLARFGGDEFIIVCPLIELEGVEKLSGRIVELVHHSVLSSPESQKNVIEVSVSVGGSLVDYKDKSAIDIIARADEALYRVKRDGGDWYALG